MRTRSALALLLAAPPLVALLGPRPGGGALLGPFGLYGLDVRCADSAGRVAELGHLLSDTSPVAALALLSPDALPRVDAVVAPLAPLLLGGVAAILGPLGAEALLRLLCWWAAALGAWLLARALDQGPLGALGSGLALGLGPWTVATVRTESVDHLLGLGLPGALGLWLLGARRGSVPLALAGGLCLGLLAWSSAYTALVGGIALAWTGLAATRLGAHPRALLAGLLCALALATPPLLAQARHLGGHDWSSAPTELLWLDGTQAATPLEALAGLGLDLARPEGLLLLGLGLLALLPGPHLGLRLLGGVLLALGSGLLAAAMAEESALALHVLGPLWRAREPVHFGLGSALGLALLAGWGLRRLAAVRRAAGPVGLGILALALLHQAQDSGTLRGLACDEVPLPAPAAARLEDQTGPLLVLGPDPGSAHILELVGAAAGGARGCALDGTEAAPCRRAAVLATGGRAGPGACAAVLLLPGVPLAGRGGLDPLAGAPGWRTFDGGPCPRSPISR